MNNKLKVFEMFGADQLVTVTDSHLTMAMTKSELLSRVDDDGVGHVFESGGIYGIESIRRTDVEVIVAVSNEAVLSGIVTSATVVDQIMSVLQKKDGGISHIQVTLRSFRDGDIMVTDNRIGFVKMPENLSLRMKSFDIEDSVVFRMEKDTVRIKGTDKYPGTNQIISVDYAQDEEQGKQVLKHGLFKAVNNRGEYKWYLKQGRKYYNLEDRNDSLEDTKSLKKFWVFGASPSNDRQKVIYMIDVTYGTDRAHAILNELTWGAYNLTVGKYVSYDQLAKMSSRWFQWMAPSISLGTVGRLAIFDGNFNDNKMDGMGFSSSEAMSDHIFQTKGIRIEPKALEGVFWQGRPCQTKAGYVNVSEKDIWTMIYALDANPIILNWSEITPEFQADMEAGAYKGRVVVLGEGTVEFLMDRNILKSDYNYSLQPEYTLLKYMKANESNFSATIMQKMVAKDPERAAAFASKLVVGDITGRLERAYYKPQAKVLAPDKFGESFYMDEVIQSVFPEYVKMDSNIGMSVLDNTVKAANKILQKFKTNMQGKNSGMIVGMEHVFGIKGFLGDHEVVCPAATRMFVKDGTPEADRQIFMIKYPSMDIDEYQIATVVSLSEIKRRIKESDISGSLKSLFIRYYCSLHDSVIVVPGCELFKNMLAGSDFDTDQLCWSLDKELIEILAHSPVAIVIED